MDLLAHARAVAPPNLVRVAILVSVEPSVNVALPVNARAVAPQPNLVRVAIRVTVERTANVDRLASVPPAQRRRLQTASVRAEMAVNVEPSASVGQVASVRAVDLPHVASVQRSVAVEQTASAVQAASVSHASAEHLEQIKLLQLKKSCKVPNANCINYALFYTMYLLITCYCCFYKSY